jgi:hypothetical protein
MLITGIFKAEVVSLEPDCPEGPGTGTWWRAEEAAVSDSIAIMPVVFTAGVSLAVPEMREVAVLSASTEREGATLRPTSPEEVSVLWISVMKDPTGSLTFFSSSCNCCKFMGLVMIICSLLSITDTDFRDTGTPRMGREACETCGVACVAGALVGVACKVGVACVMGVALALVCVACEVACALEGMACKVGAALEARLLE